MIKRLFKAFDFFHSASLLLCREKDIFAATAKGVVKSFIDRDLWKTSVKELIFSGCRLGIYSFTKNEVIHRCSLWVLVAPSAGCFTDSNFQVGSFVKHLLWHQKYLEWTTSPMLRSASPPLLCYTPYLPINIEIFSTLIWIYPVWFSSIKLLLIYENRRESEHINLCPQRLPCRDFRLLLCLWPSYIP